MTSWRTVWIVRPIPILLALVICLVDVFGVSVRAQSEAIQIAQRLPPQSAILVSMPDSGKRLKALLYGLGISPAELETFLDLWLHTNVSDGTELVPKKTSVKLTADKPASLANRIGFTDFLFETTSIHFVGDVWQSEIGEWALLIEHPAGIETIGRERLECYASLLIRLLARFGKQNVRADQYGELFSAALTDQMWIWENSMEIGDSGKWICIGSSASHSRKMLRLITNDPRELLPNSLLDQRAFKSWIANSVPNSDVEIYLATAEAVKLLECFYYLPEKNSWLLEGYDETPWFGYWWQWQDRDDRFVVEQVRKRAATNPLSSISKLWPAHKTLDEFFPFPEDAISINGRHLDLQQWNEIAESVYDSVGGEGTFQRYQSNTLVAFRNGSLRPKLGHVQFEYLYGLDSNPLTQQRVTVYKIEPDASDELIELHLSRYYKAMTEQAKLQYYEADYTRRTINGNVAWWTDRYHLNPEIKRYLSASGRVSSEVEESATGSIIFGDYVVSGREDMIRQTVDWDAPGELSVKGGTEYVSQLSLLEKQYGLPGIHSFSFSRELKADSDLRTNLVCLFRALPLAMIDDGSFERALHDAEFLESLSRPQRLCFLLRKVFEGLGKREPRFIEIEGYDDSSMRKTTIRSWQFK